MLKIHFNLIEFNINDFTTVAIYLSFDIIEAT